MISTIRNLATLTGIYDSGSLVVTSTNANTDIVEGLDAAKTASKTFWAGGTMTYTVLIQNDTDIDFETPTFSDPLDPKLTLVPESVKVDGTAVTYTFENNTLSFVMATIAANTSKTVTFDVKMV